MGRETGQTAAEYLGVLVVIAAIVFTLASTDTGAQLRGHVVATICKIGGGECEAPAREPVTGSARAGRPWPVPSIPWDGSLSVGGRTPGEGLYLDAAVTEARSACTLNSSGEPQVDLSVTGTFKAGAAGGTDRPGGPNVNADGYVGRDTGWGISTDPENAERFQDGEDVPTPVDPTSIPEDTTLTLSESTYAGLGLGASYRGIQGSLGYEEGTEVASSVQRKDADTVSITVGDADFVKQSASVGVPGASVGYQGSEKDARSRSVDLDISTPAGRQAYNRFLDTGRLPSGPAASEPTQTRRYTTTDGLGANVEIPGAAAGVDGGQAVREVVAETDADGNTTYTAFRGGGDVTSTSTWTEYANGITSAPTHDVNYGSQGENTDANLAAQLNQDPGYDGRSGSQDVLTSHSEADLQEIVDAAQDADAWHEAQGLPDTAESLAIRGIADGGTAEALDALHENPEDAGALMAAIQQQAARERFGDDYTADELASVLPDTPVRSREAACD